MLYNKTDSNKYIAEFKERFANFAQKAPILLSFIVTDKHVTVIHENSSQSYVFDWDFTTSVKSFIHEIKQVLSDNHYPRIERVIKEQVALTPEEQAEMLASGVKAEDLPSSKELSRAETYRIDKVIALKDVFILQDEKTFKSYRYKMHYSSIFFLKNYRTGKYASLAEAGAFFFAKSELLNELIAKD